MAVGTMCDHCSGEAVRAVDAPGWLDAGGEPLNLCGEAYEELATALRTARHLPRLSPGPEPEAPATGAEGQEA